MPLLHGRESGRHAAFGGERDHRAGPPRLSADQPVAEPLEHRPHDHRHPGHHEHVGDLEPGRLADRIVEQRHPLGNVGHLPARLVEFLRRVLLSEHRHRVGIALEPDAERLGDAGGGDVVVGGADAAGGEYVIEGAPAGVDGIDDRVLVVADDPRLHQSDAEIVQPLAQIRQVDVGGTPRQHLVADDDHTGGDGLVRGHGFSRCGRTLGA